MLKIETGDISLSQKGERMIRTHIQLNQQQERALRRFAGAENISLSEAVRRCIDKALISNDVADLQSKYERAASLIGAFSDSEGADDLSLNHDDYLDGAFD